MQAIVSNFSDPRPLNKHTVLELSKLRRPHDNWSQLSNVSKIQALRWKLPLEELDKLFDIRRVSALLTDTFNKHHCNFFELEDHNWAMTRCHA